MNVFKLAFQNFKRSFSTYFSLILSLAFTILVVVNLQNMVYSGVLDSLQGGNRLFIESITNTISIVLLLFMFFFVWYATNVFLNRRKKEIGIYVFMGLTNRRIGQMYAIEISLIGLVAFALGVGAGALVGQLFQMVVFAMSDLDVDMGFRFSLWGVMLIAVFYGIIYGIFVLKGYISIVRSSVLGLITAGKRDEYVRWNGFLLFCRAILGMGFMANGFYMATKDAGLEVIQNMLAAVVLVIIGVYLLFGGFIPLVFQSMVKRKELLYGKGRVLWLNQMVFRIRKNYRTYAMTCVLMLCSVSALAAGFAMRNRYDMIIRTRHIYNFQFVSPEAGMGETLAERIRLHNEITCSTEIPMLRLDDALFESKPRFGNTSAAPILRYSDVVKLADAMGLEKPEREPADDEMFEVRQVPLMSFYTEWSGWKLRIDGRDYLATGMSYEPYLGYLEEFMDFYVMSDRTYEQLLPLGQEFYTYNYRIADMYNGEISRKDTDDLVKEGVVGRYAADPYNMEEQWVKVMYPLCFFAFLVFVLASGSVLFMKLYNDSFEERERYGVLQKLGCDERILNRSIAKELFVAYVLPFAVMAVSALFSVHALEKLMSARLLSVYLACVLVVFLFFAVFYMMSVVLYRRVVLRRG